MAAVVALLAALVLPSAVVLPSLSVLLVCLSRVLVPVVLVHHQVVQHLLQVQLQSVPCLLLKQERKLLICRNYDKYPLIYLIHCEDIY